MAPWNARAKRVELPGSNGNQKSEPAETHLFDLKAADEGVLAITDRARVDFVAHTKGRHRIMDPAAAHAIKSKQRKYQLAPIPRPPTVQVLLKLAGHLDKKLKVDPGLTRDYLAWQHRIEPSFLTRILNLLKLSPEIQAAILELPPTDERIALNERNLGAVARMADPAAQWEKFKALSAAIPRARLKLRQPAMRENLEIFV